MFETKLSMQTWLPIAHTSHPWQCPRSVLRYIRSSSGLGFVHFNTYKDEAKDTDKTGQASLTVRDPANRTATQIASLGLNRATHLDFDVKFSFFDVGIFFYNAMGQTNHFHHLLGSECVPPYPYHPKRPWY